MQSTASKASKGKEARKRPADGNTRSGPTRPDQHADAATEPARVPSVHRGIAGVRGRLRSARLRDADVGPFGVLVDEGAPNAGQIERRAFMARLEERIRAAADEELALVGRTATDCPYLEAWLAFYRNKTAAQIERAIRQYTGAEDASIDGLTAAVVSRVRVSIQRWREKGQPSDQAVPPGLALASEGQDSLLPPSVPPTSGNPQDTVLGTTRVGEGSPLEPALRNRFASAFGTPLDHVRIHHDASAQAMTRAQGARALAWGPHVLIGPDEWSPNTVQGQALLAHELAHVRQQSTADSHESSVQLERHASRSAVAALRRLYGAAQPAPSPGPGAGLRLQSCGGPSSESGEVTAGDRQWTAPYLSPANQAAVTSAADVPDPTTLLSAPATGWTPIPDDHMLAVQSGDRLFLVPAHYFVSQGTGPLAAPATPTDPSRRPVAGMTAVGHGSLQVLNVGGGTGILLDAGGAGGATRTILPGSLAALQRSLGIARIDEVLLMHTHADHVRLLLPLIESGLIRGNRVWIWPGWEQATRGPWADVLAALRDPSMTARGFGPAWSPTPLSVQTMGATGTELTVATLPVGTAELSMVTRTADLQAYVSELQSGSTGTRTADASSMLTRVRAAGAADVLVVGDLRGRTIAQISSQMDAGGTRFSEWVARVRVVVGFHHLGNVETGADTAGYSTLLRALPTGETVTIVAQADPSRVNTEFRNRLTAAGYRVVVLPRADATAQRQFALSQSGRVQAPGASVYEATGAAAEANARVARLHAASEVLRNPEVAGPLLVTGGTSDAQNLAAALETEARTLEQAVRERRELEMRGVETRTRPADYATRATASDTALRAQGAEEARLGVDTLTQLARFGPRVGELARLMGEVARTGSSRPELRRLIEAVGPDVFREVLARYRVPELGPSVARERAIRASIAELLRQRDLQAALETGPGNVGMVGKGVAVFMAVVELANAIGPYIARARDAANASKLQRLMSLVGAIGWWERLQLNVRFEAYANGRRLDPQAVGLAIARRIWEATPPAQRIPEDQLPQPVKDAHPLVRLSVPSVTGWPPAFWALYIERLATIMPTWNEWIRWIDDDPGVGIRVSGDLDSGTWQVLTGTVDWDGTSMLTWETSTTLTTAMRARLGAVRAGTAAWLGTELAPPAPPDPSQTSIGRAPGDIPSHSRASFKPGVSRAAFGPYGARPVGGFSWSAPEPLFVLYNDASAPDGKVWATGADEATYRDIRRMHVYRYDPDAVVQIRRPTSDDILYGDAAGIYPTWYDWATSHGSSEERTAAELIHQQAPGAEWVPYPDGHRLHGSYYGEVRFPSDQSNTSGMILLQRSDLLIQGRQ